MTQNEYDVDIKLSLENSIDSLTSKLDRVDKKIEEKIASYQKQFQKIKTPDKGTEQDYIKSQMSMDQTYVDLSSKKQKYTKGLEAAKALKGKIQAVDTAGIQTELLTLVDNLPYINELLPILKEARIKTADLAKTVKLAKSEANKIKTVKTVSKPKIVSEPSVKSTTVPQIQKKRPVVVVPDNVTDKDSYRQAKELIEARKANNLKFGANKTLPAYNETLDLIKKSELRGHEKYSQDEIQQIFEMKMNEEELKKMVASKPKGAPIDKKKPYLTRSGYGTFLPEDSSEIVLGGHFSKKDGLMPNESIQVNAPSALGQISKLTGVDLGNYGKASMFQIDEYYSALQEGWKEMKVQLETATEEQKPLIEAKLNDLKKAAALIVTTVTEAIQNTSVEEIKNKAIGNATVRNNGMIGSDFDPDAPYAKTSPLMREIQGRFGTKPTDFEMELTDNNKPMQRQYEPEVVRKEERKQATSESEAIAEIETKSKETMEYLGGQFWEDFAKAIETKGAQGATDLVNSLLSQFKDTLNGSYEEGEKGVAHLGASYKDIGAGEGGRIVAEPLYKDDGTPYDEYDADNSLGDSLTEEAQTFNGDAEQAQQKMVSTIRTFTQAILNVVDLAYEDASDRKTKVGLGKLKESLEKRISGFYDPSEKSVDQNFDESFNRAARLLTAGPMQIKNWKDYADATGISFKQSINRTRQGFVDKNGDFDSDKADEFMADVTESQIAYRNFTETLKDDWSNFDEAIDKALSSDSKETREITAQINSFRANPEMWEKWKSNLRQEITPGARSANVRGNASEKVDRAMPVLTTAKNTTPLSPKARFIQGHGLGQAVLGTFGTSDIDEGIKRGEARLKSLTEQADKAEEKLMGALDTIKRIESEYGTHTTDKGTIVDFDLPLWADDKTTDKDIRKKTNTDINQYTAAQEIVNRQNGGQQEIDYVKTLLNAMYESKDRRELSLATQKTPYTLSSLPPAIPQQESQNITFGDNAESLKQEAEQAKQTEQVVTEAENKKQAEIEDTTNSIKEQNAVAQESAAEIKAENVDIPTVQGTIPVEESVNPTVATEHIDGLQQSIDKESQKIQVSKELTEQLIRESEAFNMVKEAVTGESEAMTKATEGETDWAKRVAEIKKELRDSAKALEEKKAAEEKVKPKEDSKPKEEEVSNPFTNFTDDELRNAGRVPLSGGEMVSYGGGKKESQLISKYLAEYQKRATLGKELNALSYKISELSKDGTKASEQELANLKEQFDYKKQAYDAQVQYMEDNGLVKTVDQAGSQSQTRIGNVILSARGAETVRQKSTVIKGNQETADVKNKGAAEKANATEQKKSLNNAIDRQKDYDALIQEEYELKRKIQGSSGDKQVEQQNRLAEVRQELQTYTDMSTKINENGQLIGQQADKQKLLDQLAQSTYLTEQDRTKKEREINNLYSEQQAKLSRFKMQNAQSAGSNTANTAQEINKYLKSLEQIGTLEREKARLQMKGGSLSGMAAIENRSLISNYDRQISGLQNQYSFKQLADGRTTLNGIELTEEEINRIEQERSKILDRNNAKMAQTQETVQQTKGFLEKLKDNFYQSFQQIGSYVMSLLSFQGIERAFSAVINRTSELDSKMVDLQIASGYTREEISGMMLDFNKLGKQIGKTTSEIAEAANDWLRAGYSGAAASQLTQASMNLSTLGMINSADATSYLISVMKGWKLEVNDIDEVVDRLVKVDMAAAISAGDLAEAMSRANNSAQMAGSTLDRYIGYLTTMTDVTQKSAASIGESMKTVYSRYQNIAAGKFVAAQSDIESENYNEDSWENLNDVEKALGALGIKIRDSVDNFRNFDDVMTEIASKWDSYSDVQQSGIATALAGTRQRENLITMFENFDLVQKYEQISANSYGTAAKKMEAYTDSVEAARQRITTSVEKFVLSISTSKFIKVFYNAVADLTENMYALAAAVTVFLLAINTKSTTQGFLSGVNTVQQKLLNFNLSQIKMGQVNSSLLRGRGVIDRRETQGLKEALNESFLSSQKEAFSKTLSSTINNLNNMDEATKTMLKDGMIPLQNSMVELESAQKKELSAVLLRQGQENRFAINREMQISRILNDNMIEAALGMVNNDKKRAILAQINQVQASTITEEQLQAAEQDAILRRQMAAKIIDQSPDEARQTLGVNVGASSRMNVRTALRDSALSLGGMAGGTWLGSQLGKMLGSGGATVGASIGAVIGNVASTTMVSQLAAGATWKGALTSLGFLWPAIGILVVGGIVGAFKSHKENIKKGLAEVASEASEEYSANLNVSAETVTYDKLVSGVDYLGKNISLTDEEYQKFLDSSNALAEAFPDLVVRTDEFGNKLVGPAGLSGKVGEVTKKVDELTEASRKAADSALFKVEDKGIFGKSSGFSNAFDEQRDILYKANNTLKYKQKNIYGVDVFGLNEEIALRESTLENIGKNKETESNEYKKAKKELEQLKLDRDALFEDINTAKDALAEYTEQLISYANTANGKADFEGKFGGLEDQLNDMSDNGKNLVLSSVKLAIRDMEFTDEEDYKNKVLSLTQKTADLLENNPVIADIYYGIGEFKTLGDQQDAMEKMIPVLEEIFGADGYDDAEKAIIEHLGLKIVVDGDKTSIEVESLGETFAKGFANSVATGATTQKWDKFIGTLTQDQYKQLNSLQKGGWITAGSVYNPETVRKMLGVDEYQTTDIRTLVNQYKRKRGNGWFDSNGRTEAGNTARNEYSQFQNDLMSNPDERSSFSKYMLSKTEIGEKFASYGQDFMERFEAMQSQLAEDIKGKTPEEVNKAMNDFYKQLDLESGLQEEINAMKPITEAIAQQVFSNIDVDGYIDSWSELKAAFEDIKGVYDDLADAQSEMNSQGHLQVQTVLDLLDSDENYIQALYVENEQIKLKSNAEEIMNEIKLRGVQISLQQSIAEKELEKAQLESQLRALYGKKVYTEAADDTVNATDNKITAFQAESDALADVTNSYLTLAQAELAANRAKLADNEGAIAAVQGTISNFKAADTIKSTQLKRVDRSKIIDYSAMSDDEYKAQKNYLERSLKAIAGEFKYDDKTGQFSYNMDKQGHYTEGVLGMKQHLEGIVTDIINSGAKAGKTFGKVYDSLKGASKDAKDSVNDLLKALDSLIDKEWEAMKVWDEDKQESTGYTAYFKRKRESLAKLAAVAKSKMDSAATEEERADAEKDYIEYQKQINNLDDEEIEDKYNILELQGASLDKLIEMQKVYIQTSDTEEENLERNKKLVELLQQQVELHREVSEWQRDNTDRLIDRLSGDAFGNEAYDRAIGQQIDAVNDELVDTQKLINDNYARAVKDYEQTGHTHAEALRLAYTGNNDYSQALRDEMTKYYDLIDKRTEYTIKKMEDKADDLNRRLDLIEKEKPDEWFKIGDIDSYYTQRMDLLQKQVELYQDALKDTSDMTDEQIQNIVDSLNEATLNLKQAQIDNLKDQTDLQSKQYDAIVYRINLWKDEIQDAIDAIEDAYEDEIKPIQDINDELERQGKLEDLLAAKKAAQREKERVFREGIGWVYESPVDKRRQAEKDIDDFNRQDKLDDLEKTKDAEVKALEDLSKAWDLYLKELEWDYNEFERINNERILKELMGCETEEEIRERITTDMKKFNQNALENYKNYNTIFQDNLLTPYKNNLVELQKLYEQTAQLVNSINGLWVNNNDNLTYDQLLADSAANNKLNLSVDYSAQMLAAKDEETFWKLANLRDQKALAKGIDISGNNPLYRSNQSFYNQWKNGYQGANANLNNLNWTKDYSAAMLNASSEEEFWNLAAQRDAKAALRGLDTTGVDSRYRNNDEFYKLWAASHKELAKGSKKTQKVLDADNNFWKAYNQTDSNLKSDSIGTTDKWVNDMCREYVEYNNQYNTLLNQGMSENNAELQTLQQQMSNIQDQIAQRMQLSVQEIQTIGAQMVEAQQSVYQQVMSMNEKIQNAYASSLASGGGAVSIGGGLSVSSGRADAVSGKDYVQLENGKYMDLHTGHTYDKKPSGSNSKNTTSSAFISENTSGGRGYGVSGSIDNKRKNAQAALNKRGDGKIHVSDIKSSKSYSTGIENGPVTYTGLAMLHGTPGNPEFVLNSDQAYTLLRNMATTKLPETKKAAGAEGQNTQYIVQGDIVLENTNNPAQFWDDVSKAMSNRHNVTKNR